MNEELSFCENSKKKIGGGRGGVRVDVNEELKFLGKLQKKNFEGGGLRGGVRVDVNAMLGVGGDVG